MQDTLVSAAPIPTLKPLYELKKECEEVARTAPDDTHKMGSLLQQMSLNYYQDVRKQAQQSFYCALGAAAVGTLFFIYAANILMTTTASDAKFSIIAGALVQVISAINFYLYARAARQFASFHICLERTNRFLLANTLCENLICNVRKDKMRQELILTVANAPMLTLDIVTNGSSPPPNVQNSLPNPDLTTSTADISSTDVETHKSRVVVRN